MSTWSLTDNQSTKSWGTPQLPVTSPTVTWGTLPSTASSTSSLQGVVDHKTSWSSPDNGYSQGWTSNASPPLYPSLGSSQSVASYHPYPASSSPLVPSPVSAGSWTQLNPLLDSYSPQCLIFDIGALTYMPNTNGPAVHPPVTSLQLLIIVPSFKWHMNIQVHGSLSVSQVVQHLFDFLQGYQNPQHLQQSKVVPSGYNNPSQFREQNHPNGFHSGQRRIDLLGRHRIFRGLSPEPRSTGAWVVHLSDR